MSSDANDVIEQLSREASTLNWPRVARSCAALRAADSRSLLVACAGGVDVQAFLEWMASLPNPPQVTAVLLPTLQDDPWPALGAGRVITLVSAEHLPGPDDLATWSHAITPLPIALRSVAVIADRGLASAADVAAVSRVAWGMFAPEPKPIWDGQDLGEHNILLWSPAQASGQDLSGSRARIADFIATPAPATAREAQRERAANLLLTLAEDEIRSADSAARAARADQRGQPAVWQLQQIVNDLADRLRRTMHDTDNGRQVALRAAVARMHAAISSESVGESGHIADEVNALRRQFDDQATSASADWLDLVRRELEGVSWRAFPGVTEAHRTALLEVHKFDIRLDTRALSPFQAAVHVGDAGLRAAPSRPVVAVGTTAAGAIAGALLAGPAGAAVGAFGGAAAGWRLQVHLLEEAAAARRRHVDAFADDAARALRLQTQEVEPRVARTVRAQMERIARDSAKAASIGGDQEGVNERSWGLLQGWRGRLHPMTSPSV